MSSFAHADPGQRHVMMRAELAAQSFEHMAFTIESLRRFARKVAAAMKPAIERWLAARQQAAQDRLFLELALTDRRVVDEIRAIRDHAQQTV